MADIKKINIKGTDYDIVDASAVHVVDGVLSTTSINPVQNVVITNALADKEDKTNKVPSSSSLSSSSTDTQYPSALLTYNELQKRLFVLPVSFTNVSWTNSVATLIIETSVGMSIISAWNAHTEFAITANVTIGGVAQQIFATKSRTTTIDGGIYYLFVGEFSNGTDNTKVSPLVVAISSAYIAGKIYLNYHADEYHSHGLMGGPNGYIDSGDALPIQTVNNPNYGYSILVNDIDADGPLEPTEITFGRDDKNAFLNKDATWSHPGEGHFDVAGSGSTAAKTTSPYCAAIWKGTHSNITALYDGLSINYTLDVTGNATYGTVLNLNELGNHPVLTNAGAAIGNVYAAGATLQLVYYASVSASVYINATSASSITGCWKVAIAEAPPYYVHGTGSTASKTSSPYYASRWRGSNPAIKGLYTGLTINYKIDVAGNGTYGTVLDLNGWGEHPVVANVNTMVSTRYAVNCVIPLIYDAVQTGSVYINSASASTVTGCWKIADYDSNTITQTAVRDFVVGKDAGILYRYQICMVDEDDGLVPFNNVNNATGNYTKAVNTTPFDPFRGLYWYGTTTNINPGAGASIGSNAVFLVYQQDARYSFNLNAGVSSNQVAATQGATVYSTSYKYAVGSYCTYAGELYKCKTAITTAGAWDASKWTKISQYSSTTAYAVNAECIHSGYVWKCTTAIGSGGEAWNASHWALTTLTGMISSYPVYIKAKYNKTTHLATLVADTTSNSYLVRSSITHGLPEEDPNAGLGTNEFYIYIFVGRSYTCYNLGMFAVHPVYYWNDVAGKATIFSGAEEAVIPTVGTLTTTAISPLTPTSNESFSGSINLHKISKTGTYSDLLSKPSLVHLYNGVIKDDTYTETSTTIYGANFAEAGVTAIDIAVGDTVLGSNGVYGKVTSWDTSTHSGYVTYANAKLDLQYTNNNPTTATLGGIPAGTTFDHVSIRTIIENLLYPYVAFTFGSISTTVASGTFEYGTMKDITKVTPTFTNGSRSINSVKIGNTSGGNNLYSGSSATSGTAIVLTTNVHLDGLSDYTVYCTLSDGTTTTTKSASFNFEKYIYYGSKSATGGTPSSNELTGVRPGVASGNAGVSITTTDNSYVWFVCPDTTRTHLQQFSSNEWVTIDTTSVGAISFLTNTGQSLTYYAYRSNTFVAGTNTFRITT